MRVNLNEMPDYLRPEDLQKVLPIGRSKAYELCRAKTFPARRIGKNIIIAKADLINWLDTQPII